VFNDYLVFALKRKQHTEIKPLYHIIWI